MATAGRVDFPTYMKEVHQDWLSNYAVPASGDQVTNSMTNALVAAYGNSPYSALAALDPSTELTAMDTAVAAFNTLVDALVFDTDWEDAIDTAQVKLDAAVFDDTYITADIAAFGDELDDQIDNIVLPRFQRGLQDVNAVMSSAFVVGEGIIEGMRDRDVAKYGTDLRVKFNFQRNDAIIKSVERLLANMFTRIEMEKTVAHYTMEANRMRIAAEKEQKDVDNLIAIEDDKWNLEIWQYGANLLAAIGGGTAIPGTSGSSSPSKFQSALSGVLAGAAIGNSIGGGWGAAVGGALGGLGGLL
jgi:hypothetical protein